MVSDSTLHALIGAVVTVVFSFVPFSPVLGGATAAYLAEADATDGTRIGAFAGAIATVPLVLLGLFVFFVVSVFSVGVAGDGVAFGLVGVFLLLLVGGGVTLLYTVGLSALGGYLGSYLVGEV